MPAGMRIVIWFLLKNKSFMQSTSVNPHNRTIGFWLFCCAGMVFGMVVLGGLTRLTGSGLSMVHWKPVTGWLPPLTTPEWQAMFELYQHSPQYLKVNHGMSLDEFQDIFWLEFIHRLWGRLIGLAFGIPLIFFIIKGWISRSMIAPLCVLFILGGAQGVLGWYMVKSGLVDDPEVSQYRLMAHLGFAFILYAALIWTGLSFVKGKIALNLPKSLKIYSLLLWGIGFITILAGALVAGLDAGLTYNTFPLMDGDVIPRGIWSIDPWILNHFENIATVQFQHRVLALLTLVFTLGIYLKFRHTVGALKNALTLCTLLVIIQVGLGITTLLMVVPTPLASLHQACGLLFFTGLTWLNFETQRSS
jgi:heme a synthase